mgnify:CR=1 FL=1
MADPERSKPVDGVDWTCAVQGAESFPAHHFLLLNWSGYTVPSRAPTAESNYVMCFRDGTVCAYM